MGESRIVTKSSGGWTHIMNSVAQDKRLSLDTRGLFLMMKSFPPDWEFNIPGLATMGNCGKDKVRRMLGELEKAGYLLREQSHDENGKFSGNTYVLQDHPPLSGKPDDGKDSFTTVVGKTDDGKNRQRETTSSANPTQIKEYIETKEESNIIPLPPKGGEEAGKKKKSRYELAEDAKPVLRRYCGTDKELANALARFIEMRTQLRAINSRDGILMLLNKLDTLSGGNRETKLLLIQEAMANSWKSVFPLKGSHRARGAPDRIQEEEGTYAL